MRRRTRVGQFFATYGWRAWAIPVLSVITVIVGVQAVRGVIGNGDENPGFGAYNPDHGTAVIGVPPAADGSFAESLPTGALPDGGSFTARGAGTWHIVPGTTDQVGHGNSHVFTYTVEIEDGVDTIGFGGDGSFATMVEQTLANPKSWIHDERFAFRRIDSGDPDFRVSLTSQESVRTACDYTIELETSCYNPALGRVVINEPRWVRGAISYQGDIGSYRQYLLNHEIGHAVGYERHQPCESQDGLAPIMMQQTFGTANSEIYRLDPEGVVPDNDLRCRFNPWPYPRT